MQLWRYDVTSFYGTVPVILVTFLTILLTLQKWLRHRNPDITVAVIKELDRRGTLKNALAGRDEQQLSQLLNFLIR